MSRNPLVVAAVVVEGRSESEVARDDGVSRRWVHELVCRYEIEGEAGLEPRSKAPLQPSRQRRAGTARRGTTQTASPTTGSMPAHTPSSGTSGSEGSTHPHQPRSGGSWSVAGSSPNSHVKRPNSATIRFQADQPNECWQADTTHWQLATGDGVEILNIIDDHSRLAITSHARATCKAADIVEAFDRAQVTYGLPAAVLTDNAAIFTSTPRGLGQVALEKRCAILGIRLHHSRAYHPQTFGKVERFHQTLERWLTAHDPATGLTETLLDAFTHTYNTARPHRAINRRIPIQAYTARPPPSPPSAHPTTASDATSSATAP